MADWLNLLSQMATEAVQQGSPLAFGSLFLVVFLTEMGIPFPLVIDTVLFLMGYQTGQYWMQIMVLLPILAIGREAGSSIIYWVARYIGGHIGVRLCQRFPRFGCMMTRWGQRMGKFGGLGVAAARLSVQTPLVVTRIGIGVPMTVAIARLVPGLLTSTSIASGIIGLRYRYFVFGIALASFFTDMALVSLGFTIASGNQLFGWAPPPWAVVTGVIMIGIVGLVIRRYMKQRRQFHSQTGVTTGNG